MERPDPRQLAGAAAADEPLLSLRGIWREFPAGEGTLAVLKDINLDIRAGEMVAIVGQSGSGKSTLMNILGCLDQPTRGSYRIGGREVATLDADELAALRREYFGFIFQRYHLLSDLTAQGNVEVPAVYAGVPREQRHERSRQLLERLGLGERMQHVPGKLSGGQQQRVSIARALMNGGSVILADEPTGALDTHSGEEVLKILSELHAQGHTVVIVTHDMKVAAHAQRIVEIRDGEIVSDRANPDAPTATVPQGAAPGALQERGGTYASLGRHADRLAEAFRMALMAMNAHRMRTFLTMLGIIIGIASVVSVVALGEGSRQQVLANISAMGTNTIEIYSGTGFGDPRASRIRTLKPSDADALAQQAYVDSVTPNVSTSLTARFGNTEASVTVSGVGEQYFRVRGLTIAEGMAFDRAAVQQYAQVAVIDDNARRALFPRTDPVGQVLLLGGMPVYVVGVTGKSTGFGASADSLNVYVPYTTAMYRLLGQPYLRSITVRVADDAPMSAAESGIKQLMTRLHGREDFYILNTDSIRQTIESTTRTMTLLISSIAVISLLVGGIGVMNIMLVSVTERTREIGVRMAVGARQADIQQQFLIEAVLVCLCGGILGILGALAFGAVFARFSSDFTLSFSGLSMLAAFACSTLIGIVFGFLPARSAARLNPVDALSRD
ncbi:MacB family efflux pump subunit [Caldimonas thermodepolymerans]|jgi:ABC-type antimicrobial peptide transport system, ATPase component|uniref:Pyoverdine export ATP-binding/permease protein PvdT n=1 Tax=Caldimonas thermodepolymerans TaxID=215580 RepID=A0A2S5T8B7_9BURK|nr:MacB family efflux pump subunit [Caldimonas thermodepolymerans]PPE71117.1 macrolide ABC transporter permease/ATP-binding protein MacB [Caldimonas thermodepolymerans]QPC31421.1 MacB family efflux pump subunit [Caldimonas thermodepolymerans]RDH99608.1 macrolide transport system ATP-binding/permease protein [Caldimonas thermodepolymerans]TCP07666.1 macrolide transport system ATP-binding/permease protein [Caldimonas thermodepolymerans]UZG44167.1 MacB family efflux pump subunit [Caldimonas therm